MKEWATSKASLVRLLESEECERLKENTTEECLLDDFWRVPAQ